MFNYILKFIKKPLLAAIIFSIAICSFPSQSHAIWGAGDTVIVTADTSVTGMQNYFFNQQQWLKSFTLDKVATLVAKQILHQMTVSVVNWINSGFEGSPAFLTNPESFFLDVADQVTGAFLATNGPLSSLCSPFLIDIRLSLALSQTNLSDQRYTCTLGKIIEAQKNGPDVIVNGQVVNSSSGSMNGFLGGDFNQGGWPAFIALTTEPQNNPYGAFLSAQGDLNARIGQRQNVIKADLQLGQGFMSRTKCKDIPGGTINPDDEAQVAEVESIVGNDPSVQVKVNKDGTQTYQTCETQTPGSVISNTLQKSLNVPFEELELANDINAIVNALMTQLISTMLNSGLHSLSGTSGSGTSYTQQIIDQQYASSESQATLDSLQGSVSSSLEQINSYISLYDEAISTIESSRRRFVSAQDCFKAKLNNKTSWGHDPEYIKAKISSIENIITNDIDSYLNSLKSKKEAVEVDKKELENISYSLAGTGSAEQIKLQSDRYLEFVQSGGLNIQTKLNTAQEVLNAAQTKANSLNTEAAQLQTDCSQQ